MRTLSPGGTLTTLITHIFPALESPIAGLSSLPRLSSLSSLSSHISAPGPKRREDLKENAALPMPPKRQKGSNFIEFYKNR